MIDNEGLARVLGEVNERRHGERSTETHGESERIVEAIFHSSHHLAVYGSLAPGKENHGLIEHLRGSWSSGYVEGDLYTSGWGAAHGFPAMRWTPGGPRIPVDLLASRDLPEAWAALDEFEGNDYRRSVVPVYDGDEVIAVANIYECRLTPASKEGSPDTRA